jgi:hypothetical protein
MNDSKMPDPVLLPDGTVSIDDCVNHINNIYGYGTNCSVERDIAVAALWGFRAEDFNEDAGGVHQFKFDRETVELPKINGTHAWCRIELTKAPNGYWAVGNSISLAECGWGFSPDIWNRIQYPDRTSALNAGLDSAIKYCERQTDRLAGNMIRILIDYKAKLNTMEHPDLFDLLDATNNQH